MNTTTATVRVGRRAFAEFIAKTFGADELAAAHQRANEVDWNHPDKYGPAKLIDAVADALAAERTAPGSSVYVTEAEAAEWRAWRNADRAAARRRFEAETGTRIRPIF